MEIYSKEWQEGRSVSIIVSLLTITTVVAIITLTNHQVKVEANNRHEMCKHFLESRHNDQPIEEQAHLYKLDKMQASTYCL
jgi:hypothetical protein